MKRSLLPLLCVLLLAACTSVSREQPTAFVPRPTPTVDPDTCYFTWGTQALPEISEEFQNALKEVISNAEGRAQAYGENCIKQDHSSTFSAMQTDFMVILPVADLTDEEAIGQLVEQVLGVVDQFSPPRVPGAKEGLIAFTVTSGENNLMFRVPVQAGRDLREQGLQGAELLQTILANQ